MMARPISKSILSPLSFCALLAASAMAAGVAIEAAELVGYAILHPDTFARGPACGAFDSAGRRGEARFPAQPVQGFSAIRPLGSGAFLALSDNGFGAKKNSPDFLLRIYTLRPDFRSAGGGTGAIGVGHDFIQLRDPAGKAGFLLVNENTEERLLTGADFDPESLVAANDGTFWVGDEFGPFLLHFDKSGQLLRPPVPVPDPRAGKDPSRDLLISPDNPFLVPPAPGAAPGANLGRSRGFEAMALGADGSKLYAMLEGPLAGDPPDRLTLLEFDLSSENFTGRSWAYGLTAPLKQFEGRPEEGSVRDMATINGDEFIVMENDTGHGPEAEFKKIFLINLNKTDKKGYLAKEPVADLMDIRDPNRLGGPGPKFAFPYMCIEGLAVIDGETVIVANDNNYPQDGARRPGVKDPEEILLLKLDRKLDLAPGLAVK